MPNKNSFLKFVLLVGDVFLMYGALLLALALRYGDFSFWPGPQTRIFLFHFSFISLFWVLLLFLLDFYEIPPPKEVFEFFANLIIFIFLAGAFGIAYFYLRPQPIITPKTILVLDLLIFSLFLCGWRYLFSRILKLQNLKEKIVVMGFRPELKEILSNYLNQSGYEIVAFFNPKFSFTEELNSFSNLTKDGIISDTLRLKEIIEKEGVNSIIFASDPHKNGEMIREIFTGLPLKLNYISFDSFYENLTKKVPIEVIDEIWFLENLSRTERRIDEILKRGFDVLFSVIGLLITAILFPFIALAIKIGSSGSIFYPQKRVGKDKKIFTLYKFRTMKEDLNQDKEFWREKDPTQLTRVGKFLRRIHLDEFPQFWSILKGDLSFVGPRPEWEKLARIFEKEIPFYSQRYLIRPGLTGWAQLNYPASTSIKTAKEKFEYDLYYIKNRSFFLDLGIILKTIRIIFR